MNTTNIKDWTITIKKKDVFFDIDILSLYFAEVVAGDSPVKSDRIAAETAKPGQARVFKRLCDHRLSDIKQLLEKFITPTISTSSTRTEDDTLATGDWTINLTITDEADDNTLPTITDLVHDYLVSGALADWYAQVGIANNRESLNLRAQNDYDRIRELIYYRPMP